MELERLRQWLRANGFSYGDLSRAVKLDYNYINMIMRGERPINDGLRWKFARAFGFDAAAEVFGDGDSNGNGNGGGEREEPQPVAS